LDKKTTAAETTTITVFKFLDNYGESVSPLSPTGDYIPMSSKIIEK
jgi:hypothetical protein